MYAKTIFHAVVICIAVSCNSAQKDRISLHSDCIGHVMAVDDSLGKIRNRECEILSLSETIANYTRGMQKINRQNCSEDFRKAFQSHINTWNEIRIITDRYPDKRGEMHVLFKELEQSRDSVEFKKLQTDIWATWREVEKFAKK